MIYSTPFFSISTNLLASIPSFKITVLLIDDQKLVAEVVKRMLSDQSDIDFHYCSDPKEALKTAMQVKPTVILQDLVMPGYDGLLLVKYLKNNPETRDISPYCALC